MEGFEESSPFMGPQPDVFGGSAIQDPYFGGPVNTQIPEFGDEALGASMGATQPFIPTQMVAPPTNYPFYPHQKQDCGCGGPKMPQGNNYGVHPGFHQPQAPGYGMGGGYAHLHRDSA